MKKSLKKKIFLSNLLEQVEINRDTKKIISQLDALHSKAKSPRQKDLKGRKPTNLTS